jgi:uncharacterized protein (DUF362 family)
MSDRVGFLIGSRRFFLTWGLAVLGSIWTWPFLPRWGRVRGSSTSKVVVAGGEPSSSVRAALDVLGGIDAFVKTGDRVLLKPNASFPNPPEWGCTTHPDVVVTMAKLSLEAGAKRVLVVDNTLRNPEICFQRSGIRDALDGIPGVHLIAPKQESLYEEVEVPGGKSLHRTGVYREVLEADCWINLPTAKTHSASGVSLSLKNLMGLVWDRRTFHRNLDLDQAIADLAIILKPAFTLMDANYALLTAGPGGPGKVEQWNKVVAGLDPLAVDAFTVSLGSWYGRKIRPDQVKHLRAAHGLGLGTIDLEGMQIVERG